MTDDNRGDSLMSQNTVQPIGDGGANPTSPLQLRLERIRNNSWRTYIIKNHPMHTAPAGCVIAWGVYFNHSLRGVIVFGRPVSSNIDQQHTLEETRFWLDDTCPKLSESRVLAIAVRLLKKEYPHIKRLIAYCDRTRCGPATYLRACGWTFEGWTQKHDGWTHRKGRRAICGEPKQKYTLDLTKTRQETRHPIPPIPPSLTAL